MSLSGACGKRDGRLCAMNTQADRILIGNSFPLTLIRGHRVVCEEIALDALREKLAGTEVVSFWGHENTRAVAEAILGVGLKPACDRPVLKLDSEGYPAYEGVRHRVCYVLSPDYVEARRPAVGEVVPADAIRAWYALRLVWD